MICCFMEIPEPGRKEVSGLKDKAIVRVMQLPSRGQITIPAEARRQTGDYAQVHRQLTAAPARPDDGRRGGGRPCWGGSLLELSHSRLFSTEQFPRPESLCRQAEWVARPKEWPDSRPTPAAPSERTTTSYVTVPYPHISASRWRPAVRNPQRKYIRPKPTTFPSTHVKNPHAPTLSRSCWTAVSNSSQPLHNSAAFGSSSSCRRAA